MLTKKKRIIYIAAVITFVLMWALFLVFSLNSAKNGMRRNLNTDTLHTSVTANQIIQLASKNISATFLPQWNKKTRSPKKPEEILENFSSSRHTQFYYLIDENGTVYSKDGVINFNLSDESLTRLFTDGYTCTMLPQNIAPDDQNMFIASILPGPDKWGFGVTMPFSGIVPILFNMRGIGSDSVALFSAEGEIVYPLPDSPKALSEEFATELQLHAELYLQDPINRNLQKAHVKEEYFVYMPLNFPDGGFLGLQQNVHKLLPSYNNRMQFVFASMLFCIFLIGILFINHHITKRDQKKALDNAVFFDSLTGMLTIAGLNNNIKTVFPNGIPVGYSVIALDIVAFHRFNNIFGHSAGDNLLKCLADYMKTNYMCGTRINNDVFLFITPSENANAEIITQCFFDLIKTNMGEHYIAQLAFNFGAFPVLNSTHTFKKIYDSALLALKNAKNAPNQNIVIYGSALQKKADLQNAIELNMARALSLGEFKVYIQPKHMTCNGYCYGGEALIRWESETLGMLMPDTFIEQFEVNGFILEIDFFMLRSSLDYLQRRLERNLPLQNISVNQSRITLNHPNYLARLQETISKYTVPLQFIELEITENAFQSDYNGMIKLVNEMRRIGFSVAMDDFGTGFSSLNTLREIPVTVLKIDKEFLNESDNSERSRTIIRHIIEMSKELGISVVCEGVETKEQYDFLKNAECDYVQGFYFSKPLPHKEYEEKYILEHST